MMGENNEVEENPIFVILQLKTSLKTFAAILPPVFFTMLLSAITVLYVTPDAKDTFGQSPLILNDEEDAQDNTQAAGQGLVNALVIIGAITAMTFLIVLLLYLRCEMFFAAYLFIALVMLMGFTTGTMVVEGLQSYEIPTDIVTLFIFFYNYAIVGALAIFSYEFGFQGPDRLIPYNITQTYLVLVSVVMAWLVTSIFPDFTVWALLVCLALYDLCAVLTPCGPLNLLLKVVTNRQQEDQAAAEHNGGADNGNQRQMMPGLLYEVQTGNSTGLKRLKKEREERQQARSTTGRTERNADAGSAGPLNFSILMAAKKPSSLKDDEDEVGQDPDVEVDALADREETAEEEVNDEEDVVKPQPLSRQTSETPPESAEKREERLQRLIAERDRLEKQLEQEMAEESNLKLGLGDFVFYSVLTSKSAEFGFTAFISVTCCVLCGLCGTLILLSVFQKALPALPISIALGVMTYVLVFLFVSPFADGLVLNLVTI